MEHLEANELLALLANLGAQQQAVLAAIAERQHNAFQGAFQAHPQRAAGRETPPEQKPLHGGNVTVPVGRQAGRQVVDINVAAGDAATAAQQKHWRL